MFDGLLKSKFYGKCKSGIKDSRIRIELIRNKRNATEKHLRNDVADLLKNGFDINAYRRAEGLIEEMNGSGCYEFVGQCLEHLSNNVSVMNKQSECPEDCREAVASIMFGAARLPRLPELRELRNLFSERYGSSLDCFINKQFAEKMKPGFPSKDLMLQLLQDIAAESGLDWDSKALEKKLLIESAYDENFVKETDDGDCSLQNKKDHLGTAYELKHTRQSDPQTKKDLSSNEQKEASRKPLNYRSIPPPYTKSKVNKPNHVQDDSGSVPKAMPVPKSVRRHNLKPELEEEEKIQQINKERAAQGQRILKFFDDGGQRDNEEKMDKLLKHYSRKNGSSSDEKGKATKHKTTNRVLTLPTGLAASLPEASRKFTRSSSYQPELLHGNNGHVHPKMPDYDVFVARLAALRGNSAD